ncbi:MAG: hypothetical protein IBX57_00200 [Gammaproteobacteria bacterium]|nr:hypothetical protein [Gammaproteobacteria bacterium]
MQYIVTKTERNTLSYITVRHGNKEIEWNVTVYGRSTLQNPTTMFDNVNAYMKTLPDDLQDKIFDVYVNVGEVLDNVTDFNKVHTLLQKQVAILYNLLDFEALSRWVKLKGQINTPTELKTDFDTDKNELTEKLTYLRDDYRDLIAFSLYLKPMLPIFGEYLNHTSRDISGKFRDHFVLSLLSKSKVIKLNPYKRLEIYINASIEKEERKAQAAFKSTSAVFGGLGSSELPEWLMSKVIIRRVVIYEETLGDSLIANIYHTITQQVNSLDKTFSGRINEKRPTGNVNDDDNASIAENYKVKQEISDGDLTVLSVYTDRFLDMASIVDPTIDPKSVEVFIKHFDQLEGLKIQKHHLVLAQWVLSKAISPRGVPSLNKPSLLKAMGVTQALLWHWGFQEVSLLLSAQPAPNNGQHLGLPTSRVSKYHTEKFQELYPYQRRLTSNINLRSANVGLKAIDIVSTDLISSDWFYHPPESIRAQLSVDVNKPQMVSAEIRQNLSDLIIKLNEL